MWTESSSVNALNLVKKSATIPEIENFSGGITFWRSLYINLKITVQCMCMYVFRVQKRILNRMERGTSNSINHITIIHKNKVVCRGKLKFD